MISFLSDCERDFLIVADREANKFMAAHFPPDFTYQQFGAEYRANFFNASQWVEIFAGSGAQYVVLTTKHHDGFANWPSSRNFGWNSRDIGQFWREQVLKSGLG